MDLEREKSTKERDEGRKQFQEEGEQ